MSRFRMIPENAVAEISKLSLRFAQLPSCSRKHLELAIPQPRCHKGMSSEDYEPDFPRIPKAFQAFDSFFCLTGPTATRSSSQPIESIGVTFFVFRDARKIIGET